MDVSRILGVEAPHALVSGSFRLLSLPGEQYHDGPGADVRRLLGIIEDFGTGKLRMLPDQQVIAFLHSVERVADGIRPFLRQVEELNDNLNEIQQRIPEVVESLRCFVVAAAAALALALATVFVGVLLARWFLPQPQPPIVRRWLFVGAAAVVAVLAAAPSYVIHAVLAFADGT
jgi:hypothetical protein